MSQEELIALCVKKDRQAWDEFVRTYQGLVRKAAYYRLSKSLRNDVDDIVQEVFLMLWKDDKLSKLRDASRLKGWLVVVTMNLTNSFSRVSYKRSRIVRSIHDKLSGDEAETVEDTIASGQPDPARSAEINEEFSRVEETLDTLKRKERFALELKAYKDHTQEDISEAMNIPVNTVASLIRRARLKVCGRMMSEEV